MKEGEGVRILVIYKFLYESDKHIVIVNVMVF